MRLWRTVLHAGGAKSSTFALSATCLSGGGRWWCGGCGCCFWGGFAAWLLDCGFAVCGGAYGFMPCGYRCVGGIGSWGGRGRGSECYSLLRGYGSLAACDLLPPENSRLAHFHSALQRNKYSYISHRTLRTHTFSAATPTPRAHPHQHVSPLAKEHHTHPHSPLIPLLLRHRRL